MTEDGECRRRSEGDSFARGLLCIQITIMNSNKSPQEFPYKTYLNILHGPLELIDVQKLADACPDKWYNQTLCKVNDSRGQAGGDSRRVSLART